MRASRAIDRARDLRRAGTSVEQRLWYALRNRARDGAKFRRQHPVGRYVADFCCLDARLIVERDGGQHGAERDAARTAVLEAAGFRVLRFWNNELVENLDGVLQTIAAARALTRNR